MSLITDEYRKMNEQLHSDNNEFGKNGCRWARLVFQHAVKLKTMDVLDYGCGKSSLSHHLPFSINQYDPCVPKYSSLPAPADIVICTDVLEHIEPHLIDEVMEHLCSMVKRFGIFAIARGPAIKTLPDGRNAHLIQANEEYWGNKIKEHLDIVETIKDKNESVFYVKPKDSTEVIE